MSEYNPYRTPGLRSEDESAFSPGGQYALGGAEQRAMRRWLARHPGTRRVFFWLSIALVVLLMVLSVAGAMGRI